jgi:predicted dithiol-disulfide oxidoreductase (DUF899 family)
MGWDFQQWSKSVEAELEGGLREVPTFIAFARENGTIYHTYRARARPPRRPHSSFLLDRTPKPQPDEPVSYRTDEYPGA